MFKNKKIPYLEYIPIIIITLLLYKVIDDFSIVTDSIKVFFSYISIFIWSFGIAYLLNPLMKLIERTFKTKRGLTLVILYSLFIGTLILIMTIITPKIVTSIKDLGSQMPIYVTETIKWIDTSLNEIDKLNLVDNEQVSSLILSLTDKLQELLSKIDVKSITGGVVTTISTAINFTSSIAKVLFGFIVSIYLLKDKELFITNIKKFLYSVLNKNKTDKLLEFGNHTNTMFSKFILGKSLDSLIIGCICFIGLVVLRIPYALLISLIVGITNMIPYFGPFIGALPAILITIIATTSLSRGIWVLLWIVFLQQLDGWLIGPKILGESVGLGPFSIILAIIIGGKLFNVIGMFLAVPVMALIIDALQKFLARRLEEKNIKI